MEKGTAEVIVRLDMSNAMVRAWLGQLKERVGHPMYQGGITVIGPFAEREERGT